MIEAADYSAAARHLQGKGKPEWRALLYVRCGMLSAARECVGESDDVVGAVVEMAAGEWVRAREKWAKIEGEVAGVGEAVCEVYLGCLAEAREKLEGLVELDEGGRGAVFNLCTVYELCGDQAKGLKLGLAEKVAAQGRELMRDVFKM